LKTYEITIKPTSGFGTPLKGDTIFGHFCWQIFYDSGLTGKSLDKHLLDYHINPFVIFSSMYPKFIEGEVSRYALRAPYLPVDELFDLPDNKKEKIEKRKEYKAKTWMIVNEKQRFESFKKLDFLNDRELFKKAKLNINNKTQQQMRRAGAKNFMASFAQCHNTINRLTNTTGEGFAPFAVEQQVFYPETKLVLFVGIDETAISIKQILTGLERIGSSGFGKDASTGLGKFELGEDKEIDLLQIGSELPNACYTLSPCVPEKNTYSEMFFTPFTRFGKHGDVLAKSSNPFKDPVIMADEGAILKPKDKMIFSKPYIGSAVSGISKAEPKAVMQGYSLYIPVKVEV